MATILVVDDRPSNREYLLALLAFASHDTLQASDGAEALALARQARPCLVITDILLPKMDGCEFVRQLRADPELAAIPVIFYSAVYSHEESSAIARSCGVCTVLPKPAGPKAVFDAVNAELGLVDAAATPSLDAPPFPPTLAPLMPPAGDGPATAFERQLRALEALCLKLAAARHPEALVDIFCDAAAGLLAADQLAVCLLSPDQSDVRHLGTRGMDADLVRGAALDREHLPGALSHATSATRLDDGAADRALPASHPRSGAFLGLPVCDMHHRLGWMYASRQPGAAPFSRDEERVAVMITAHLAVAYENLNLNQLVQRHAVQLQLEASARARADAALREREHRLVLARQVFDSTAESVMMTDADVNIIAANPSFERITGYSEAEVMGQNPRLLRSGRHDTGYFERMWSDLRATGQWRGEIWNRRKNGDVYPERISISAVHGADGEVTAYVSVSTDLSALKAAHHQLDYLSQHDPLTGLANRAQLFERVEAALATAAQRGDQLALLMLNVDRLQRINDSLGHIAGDEVLREIARRTATLAGRGDTVARLGSDEFLLLRASCEDTEEVIRCARHLIDAVSQPMRIAGHDVVLTASVGIALYPRDGASSGELLKAADAALSHMKESGRDGFRFFKGEMNAQALRILSMETALRRALDQGELALHYQPQVSCHDGAIIGMEALLRWNSPRLGSVPPCDFIPMAEDTGLIVPLGSWVIREACRQTRIWQDAGLPKARVAVNVSAHQFRTGNLGAVVRAALDEFRLDASCLELELTESVVMADSFAAQEQLSELRAIGVTVSLDDFGTGYSSLGYLSRFSLDKLKIDQSFVRDITVSQRSAAIAQATVALAHGLSLSVVAEGVETAEQHEFLQSMGCTALQGYLYSRPVPAEEMARLLAKRHLLHNSA
ncbi:two-component system response regulator [Massilia terrae]|uniref:EAL domain-containing protein n=1 Tax=Massilia terrae TaxID=1811224 RepID=A0ABT2D366_9BURK|nr:EAL domain-containing protein [Massilia terrae]MCS0660667.1 EAL domain-containing protein [Massilia terrae]